ncbi:MAG: 2-oxoacid:acceptor oxidoreductase subunit alpha, partial [Nitrospinae bacterium]|nr:2-oxoacid:acceptor oxidoreductase subunit alpha [Nitrospinota bacterium]
EMNLGQVYHEVVRASKGECEVKGIFKVDTETIYPKKIMDEIEKIA